MWLSVCETPELELDGCGRHGRRYISRESSFSTPRPLGCEEQGFGARKGADGRAHDFALDRGRALGATFGTLRPPLWLRPDDRFALVEVPPGLNGVIVTSPKSSFPASPGRPCFPLE